jgi:hypothetical protein
MPAYYSQLCRNRLAKLTAAATEILTAPDSAPVRHRIRLTIRRPMELAILRQALLAEGIDCLFVECSAGKRGSYFSPLFATCPVQVAPPLGSDNEAIGYCGTAPAAPAPLAEISVARPAGTGGYIVPADDNGCASLSAAIETAAQSQPAALSLPDSEFADREAVIREFDLNLAPIVPAFSGPRLLDSAEFADSESLARAMMMIRPVPAKRSPELPALSDWLRAETSTT